MRAAHTSDGAVRQRLRELLANGRLPAMAPMEIAAGYGHGRVCIACDQPVTQHEMEYEFNDPREDRQLSFHSACFLLFQSECVERASAAPGQRVDR
ncbi:MAG: hypothetical protein JO299_01250 [Gammaproteobacteria bacterium]|nr:hypothetical protein [Gammaproteobacteria bacterium]